MSKVIPLYQFNKAEEMAMAYVYYVNAMTDIIGYANRMGDYDGITPEEIKVLKTVKRKMEGYDA